MVIRISDPMAYTSDILLGQITKLSGFEGAVTIKLEKYFFENIPRMESVFLEIDGRLVPFFISYSEYSGANILKLKFNDYDSVEKVSEFAGCKVFLTTGTKADNPTNDISSLKDYKVTNGDNFLFGVVKEVIQNPGQWLLNVVSPENKEILIPFHEDLILAIDNDQKIIIMNVPEGLMELN